MSSISYVLNADSCRYADALVSRTPDDRWMLLLDISNSSSSSSCSDDTELHNSAVNHAKQLGTSVECSTFTRCAVRN